ncbi:MULTISPECIES: hypothetical protein [Dyella]|uniref:hypothetical protein n=1 Tax=Dyella TaxID=231454 RepID=UPI000C867B65|nr:MULTISPECIES: hypothetical protein [Dyella]MDR3444449.1 hypothetical protein [Dyella sp.]PMQ05968.1 hypothetical protein DyAD56_06890 [Dyella sp. AD56]ULU25258.1 hypothetical protein DYST_02182 [Dyella terrae]
MRYLAILLLAPWLLILGWAFWAYPKSLPRTRLRRWFDVAALLLAAFAAVECAGSAFDTAAVPAVGQYGPSSGAIWQQVLPALYGYGACVVVLVLALIVRQLVWRPQAH